MQEREDVAPVKQIEGGLQDTSFTHCLHAPTVFIPKLRCGPFLNVQLRSDQRNTQCQTKHGAYVRVTQGQPEKNARSWGVSRKR